MQNLDAKMKRDMDQAVAKFSTEMAKLKKENEQIKKQYEQVDSARGSKLTEMQAA